jgi:hypothetical protein
MLDASTPAGLAPSTPANGLAQAESRVLKLPRPGGIASSAAARAFSNAQCVGDNAGCHYRELRVSAIASGRESAQ